MATQGLANYIKKLGPEMSARGVAIAYDSRHFSLEFAEEAARVLNGNCIKVHLFDAVSYTHLDVYKRQSKDRAMPSKVLV